MNREHRILSAVITSKQSWDSVSTLMDEEDFSSLGWLVLQRVAEYYKQDTHAEHVDRSFLLDDLVQQYPRFADRFQSIVNNLPEVSLPNIVQEFRTLKMITARQHLAEAIIDNREADIESYFEKYSFYKEYSTSDDSEGVYIDEGIESILEVHKPENLIPVVPRALNDRLDGGVIPGTQIAIYAPTEVGKTMVAINTACGMLEAGRKVLYCGNEDPAKSMLLRFYARLSGMDKHDMMRHPHKARELALENGYGNLVYYDMAPGSIYEIRKQVERHAPEIVFVDQMANMGTSANFTKVEKNEYLAVKLRELAKKFDLVTVILHQASDDAYGNLYIQKNDMYYSNVGVQGQMDVMLGVGMDAAFEQQGKRMLCLTKNKLSGNHEAFPVDVRPEISTILDE